MEGNQKKIREALEEILLICYKAGARYGYDVACGLIKAKAKNALSVPLRNCDVGTEGEQMKRFREFCETEKCGRYRCRSGCKATCIDRCAIVWAQMPYEAQEEGAK